jgi:hypothetical protein
MVPLIGAAVALVAVNDGILPVPFATNPIAILELVHVKLPPVGVLTKIAASTVALLHTTVSAGTITVGVGFTVMVKLDGVPAQPLTVGVTVIVAVMGAVVVLVAVKLGRLPVPLAANPIAGSEFVQKKLPPVGVLTKIGGFTTTLLHTVMFVGTVTVGVGFTVMV